MTATGAHDRWLRSLRATEQRLEAITLEVQNVVSGRGSSVEVRQTKRTQLQRQLRDVGKQLDSLSRGLDHLGGPSQQPEATGLLKNLNLFYDNVNDLLTERPSSGSASGRESFFTEPSYDSNESELEMQLFAREEQDHKLDIISEGIAQLHGLGNDLHKELNLQARLLDDLDDDMDKTGENLQNNLRGVNQVSRQTQAGSTCILCTMALLFVVIVVLLSVDMCQVFNPSRCAS